MTSRRKELEASWSRTRAHLANALARLPASPVDGEAGRAVQRYREWLDHNELELALDELEMLAELNDADRKFWEFLLRAATELKLSNHALRYRERLSG